MKYMQNVILTMKLLQLLYMSPYYQINEWNADIQAIWRCTLIIN